jgi:transcriptional regulator GlxA family with amidase domain
MLTRLFEDDFLTLGKDSPARPLIERCYEVMENGNKYAVAAAFYELMVALLRIKGVIASEMTAEAVGDSDTARIYTINTFASLYYDLDTKIEDIAEILHLSPRQVNRIVEGHFGKTWSMLITEKRMRVAEDLLEHSDMSIEKIAEYIGYSSARGFRTAYAKFYGKSPSSKR